MSKERPILFSGPMVRAILEDRKTQTRRIVKPQPSDDFMPQIGEYQRTLIDRKDGEQFPDPIVRFGASDENEDYPCPYGQPGDRLWVRETWVELLAVSPATDAPMPIGPGEKLIEPPTSYTDTNGRTRWNYDGRLIAYRANSNIEFCDGDGFTGESADREDMPKWKPSIHMPRWASRITLEVTAVRVERLQDISEDDAYAEGITTDPEKIRAFNYKPKNAYRDLWKSINGPDSWAANPWVWVVEFKKITA